jgi:ubiquinone/menaquinone biosynthesis C-methylase UbiE
MNELDYRETPESWGNYVHSFVYKKFFRSQEVKIELILNILKPNIVLDAGCGYGRYTKLMKKLNFNVHSIDISKPMIDEIKKINPQFKLCQVENIDYPDHFFDLVLCIDVADHLKSLRKAIEEFYRVLKKNGYILLTVAIPHSPFILMNKVMRKLLKGLMKRPPISKSYYDDEVKRVLKKFVVFPPVTLTYYHLPLEILYICRKKDDV